jgi:hypothetical protein
LFVSAEVTRKGEQKEFIRGGQGGRREGPQAPAVTDKRIG